MKISIGFGFISLCALIVAAPAVAKGGSHSGGYSGVYHSSSSSSVGEHRVSAYTRKDGTYVAPHYQTNPNRTLNDNYSTIGNVNPHTGQAGTKPRDGKISGY